MQTAVSIRCAGAADLDFVLALAARFAEVRPAWRPAAEIIDGTRRHFRNALEAPARDDEFFAVALDGGGERAGFIWVVTERDFFTGEPHAHISEVAVARDGTGAGRRLLAAAEAWSRGRGYPYVSLNVRPGNERARRLYAELGYEIDVEHRIKPLR